MFFEVKGGGVQYDYGFRIYDSRIARFLSVDPLTASYPWYTPYQFAGNTPIWAIDLDGLEEAFANDFIDDDGIFKRVWTLSGRNGSGDIENVQFRYKSGKTTVVRNRPATLTQLSIIARLREGERTLGELGVESLIEITRRLTMPRLTLPTPDQSINIKRRDINPILLKPRKRLVEPPKDNPPLVDPEEIDTHFDTPPAPIVTNRIIFKSNSNHIKNREYKKTISNVAFYLNENKDLKVVVKANIGLSGLGSILLPTGSDGEALNSGSIKIEHFNRDIKGTNRRLMWSRRERIIHELGKFGITPDRILGKSGSVERGSSNRTVEFKFIY